VEEVEELKSLLEKRDQSLIDKNVEIARLQEDLQIAQALVRSENESIRKELERKSEEFGIMKAKMYLDQL
jgi:hypothetical protein